MKIAIYSAHCFEVKYLEEANTATYDLTFLYTPLSIETVALSKGMDAIFIFVNDDCSKAVLEKLSEYKVKTILLRCAGYNNVDLNSAEELGITVANAPKYSPYSVAEHAVTLMMALNRKVIKAHNRVTDLNFSLDGLVGFDMHGKTVGLIGLGKIGGKLARILKGFGCKILVVDPVKNQLLKKELDLKYVSLNELCTESDIISLHAPLTEETKYILSEKEINDMKVGVMIINTSRGGLIDTNAIIKGLKQRKIGYLGLDVYEEEKGVFFEDLSDEILLDDKIARLMTFPNVLITSHQGFLTKTALTNIANTTFSNLENIINKDIFENRLV